MPLLDILLIAAAIFLLFVFALVWVEWKKRHQPITCDTAGGGTLDPSIRFGKQGAPLGAQLSNPFQAHPPSSPQGSPDLYRTGPPTDAVGGQAQRSTLQQEASGRRAQVAVPVVQEQRQKDPAAAKNSLQHQEAVNGWLQEPGEVGYADVGQQDPARFSATQSQPQRLRHTVARLNVTARENTTAAAPGPGSQPPPPNWQKASAEGRAPEQVRATPEELIPTYRDSQLKPPGKAYQRPADGTLKMPARSTANVKEWTTTITDRLGDMSLWYHLPLGQASSQSERKPVLRPHVVESTPYFRTVRYSAAAQREDSPRVRRNAGERLLVLVLWWVLVPAALIFAFYPSKSAVIQLKPKPPAEFVDLQAGTSARQQAADEKLAQAYWTCAIQSIEDHYAYNKELPAEPPPEFNIDSTGTVEKGVDSKSAARDHYWKKLREVWTNPDNWQKSYVRNPTWGSDLFETVRRWLAKYNTYINP